MWEELTNFLEHVAGSERTFCLMVGYLIFLILFLLYLLIALFTHRKDRQELERLAISAGVSLRFQYSWRGVELEIHQPADRSKITPGQGQGKGPPSPPVGG